MVTQARGDSRYTPDGYRYGVRFSDGSVRAIWNGKTQRERAEEEAARLAVAYAPDRYELVRQHWSEEGWETYV